MAAAAPWLAAPGTSRSRFLYAPPRLRVAQSYELTHGARVRAFAEGHGKRLMRWQLDVVNDWAAVDPDMQFVHRRNGGSIPRQAGKSDAVVEWICYLAAELGYGVLYTAHNYDTTCEILRRIREIFGRRADDPKARHRRYNRMVLRCENSTAQEAFFFKSGGFICFSTRTKTAKLGFSFDVIVYDEAQELTTEQMQAIAATTSSGVHHNPQELFLGTPKRPGSFGNVFGPMRDEAHSSPEDDLCWWEWGVDEIGDIADESRWYQVNPSLGEGIASLASLRMNCRKFMKLGDEGVLAFAQEFLGYWLPGTAAVVAPIDKYDWEACEVPLDDSGNPIVPEGEPAAYAVKFSPDGSTGSIALCLDADVPFVEVVANRSMRRGVTWFARWLYPRLGHGVVVVIDGKSNAQTLNDKLIEEGVDEDLIIRPSTADVVSANTAFVDATRERAVSHAGQPALVDSATLTGLRKIGRDGGFGFESNENADATLVEACALAYWCAMSIRRNQLQELRIG